MLFITKMLAANIRIRSHFYVKFCWHVPYKQRCQLLPARVSTPMCIRAHECISQNPISQERYVATTNSWCAHPWWCPCSTHPRAVVAAIWKLPWPKQSCWHPSLGWCLMLGVIVKKSFTASHCLHCIGTQTPVITHGWGLLRFSLPSLRGEGYRRPWNWVTTQPLNWMHI